MPLDDKPDNTQNPAANQGAAPKSQSASEEFDLVGRSGQARLDQAKAQGADSHVEPVSFERETIAPNLNIGSRILDDDGTGDLRSDSPAEGDRAAAAGAPGGDDLTAPLDGEGSGRAASYLAGETGAVSSGASEREQSGQATTAQPTGNVNPLGAAPLSGTPESDLQASGPLAFTAASAGQAEAQGDAEQPAFQAEEAAAADAPAPIAPLSLGLDNSAIAENSADGSAVGQIQGSGGRGGYSYALLNDGGGRFAIDPVTGVITVADGSLLDHEAADSASVTVEITDSAGVSYEETFDIAIDDVNEGPTDLDLSNSAIVETAGDGAQVGTVTVTDEDLGDSHSYSLVDDAGGRFAIDPNSGVITVADGSLLDYETATSHGVTVRVTDAGGLTRSESYTVTLSDDTSEAQVSAIADSNVTGNTVSESAADGSAVGITALASDADATDSVTYSLTENAGGRFTIDANTGVVTVADGSLLDYETATSHGVTVKATSSDGSTSTESFTVNLSDDTSEAQVSAIADSNAAGNSVSESAADGSAVGVTALASDADATDSVTYSLVDNASGRFTIDANTGVVTVADGSLLDYETATSHGVTVKATSSDGSTSTESFTVNLSDDTGEAQVSAIADSNAAGNTVSESAADGSAVGVTALASDADATDSVTYSLVDNASGRFTIDANTGVVTVADGSLLDYETATSHGVTVKATSSDGSTSTESFTVNLSDDTSEAQVSAIADSNAAGNSVSESAADGSAVGVTALASDADATDSVTYSLTDNAGGRFAIDANTGVVTVADGSLLDYETATSHGVTVKATSSDGSTSTESFTVNLSDDTSEAQVSAIADSNADGNTVSESAADGSAVGVTALASDADTTDSVSYSLANDAGGRFAIDANTGIVTVADGSLLDYETATSHGVTVKATSSDGSTSTESFTVNLSDDTSESQVSAIADSNAAGNTVSESAADGSAVGVTALASDADATDSVTYSLTDNAGGRFTIDANTGVVTVADGSLLDYETATSHGVTVKATSSDGSTSTESFTVNLSDDTSEAQVSAIADSNAGANSVSESAANGAAVGVTALASDADATDSVTYSLADNAGGRFAIDANTGVVTVADGSLLDYETATTHGVTAKATSSDGSTSTESFTVNLSDDTSEAQVSAIADSNAAGNSVSESAADGSAVGVTALASDADATDSVTYSLTDNAGGRFTIDANTGVVTVADGSLLDYETATSHGVTVKATSSDGSTSTESFTVNLSDDTSEAQVSAIADSNAAGNTVSESAADGSAVGVTALASDADATDSVTYSLTDNAGGRFTIDANTGVVTIADGSLLDYETATSHGVTVKATSSDGSTSTESFTVNLSDDTSEAQVSAIADSNADGNTVSESAADGSAVGVTALASDADTTDSVSYSLANDAGGRFAIDANTGIVTVADGSLLDYETATSHGVTVKATSSDGSTSTESFTVNLSDDTSESQVSAIADSNAAGNTVSESAADGSAVGVTALASDADATDSVTYSLTDNAGGRFTIDANTGVVTVADGSLLDYETATSHGVTVKATSSDGSTSTESFTVNLSDDTSEAQVSAIADSNAAGNTVSESAADGSAVGVTALASDADATDSVTYSLTDNAGGRFTIDANTGIVTVADGSLLDYETATSHGVTVKATSSDGSTSTESFTVNLSDDTSEAQVSAIADSNAGANSVSESAANGAAVGVTALASDADATDSVTYSLTDNAGGRFAIDANTGVVTVADGSLLDYETATSHGVTVKATSSDGSTSTESFTVNLSDDTGESSVSAIADSNAAGNSVSESAADGSAVGVTALASDADATDSVTYSLTDNAGGRFTIDANTGVVTVADGSLLDYETATSHGVTVKAASSDGSTSTESFTVNLSDDTSEAQVSAIADSNAAGNTVSESAADGSAVGVTALASDADATDSVTYSLADNAGGRFTIDANTGVVTVADGSLLDYETATSHGVTVKATSSDGSTSTESFTVNLSDDTGEAQVSAIADSNAGANSVSESAADGSAVGVTALASDADATDGVTYSLTDTAGGRFTIDANTGVVTVADGSLLDYETATSHGVTVKATSSDGSTSTESFTVNLSDDTSEAQVSAIADSNAGANSVSESAANGAAVGVTALASDADATDSVAYSLTDNAGGRFTIDANTGVVTVADGSLLNYETATSHGVTVKATSSDGSTSTESFTVNLSDDTGEAQVSAIADSNAGANSVSESAANGAAVGVTALASDADATDSVTYSLADNAGGRFTIDANTGVITVADGSLLDYETATSHGVTVKATSSDGSTSTQAFTVNVADVVETITGTPGADSLVGGSGSDVIDALGDDDRVYGGGGADSLFGGAGADSLYGGDGDDVIEGGAGGDTIDGGAGSDTVSYAGSGSGVTVNLSGGSTGSKSSAYADAVMAKSPTAYWRLNDSGSTATDSVGGHNGSHYYTSNSGSDPFGDDPNAGSADFDGNNDYVTVPYSNDFNMTSLTVQLWFKADSVSGGDKTLVALSGSGYGALKASLAIDNGQIQLSANYGGTPFEVKAGSVGSGEWHHVALSWDTGQLQIILDGTAILDLPMGAPNVSGGASVVIGANAYGNSEFNGLISEVAIHDTPLWQADIQDIYEAGVNGNDTAGDVLTSIENVIGTDFSDTLTGDAGDNILIGGGGDDTLYGGDGANTLYGGDGNDVLDDEHGNNLSGGNTYFGGAGDDKMWSGDGDDTQYGGSGADSLYGEGGDDALYGGDGADLIQGSTGDDALFGGAGIDQLFGGSGDDTLNGGTGDDQLYGGDGSDLFIFQEGGGSDMAYGGLGGGWTDTIALQDAGGGSDIGAFGTDWTISLDQGSIQDQGADHLTLSQDAAGTITLEDGSQISFEGVERVEW